MWFFEAGRNRALELAFYFSKWHNHVESSSNLHVAGSTINAIVARRVEGSFFYICQAFLGA
jgi:hypothetical protein